MAIAFGSFLPIFIVCNIVLTLFFAMGNLHMLSGSCGWREQIVLASRRQRYDLTIHKFFQDIAIGAPPVGKIVNRFYSLNLWRFLFAFLFRNQFWQ
ncbi:MAG: hypothetical protein ACLTZH_02375 [Subdoligranulum sp.]